MSDSSKRFLRFTFPIILAILAFSAMATLNISTPAGAGLANDSVAYIAGARSILQGKGYSDIWLDSALEPITHYPPLLSLSLSMIGLFGIDPLRGARILNIVLFGANTTLMGLLGWRMTRSQAAGLWLAALFMLNGSMLRIHVFALSEPLFLFLSLLAFLLIDVYFCLLSSTAYKPVWLVLAGIAAALAFLTRYSALALLPTFAITLFLFHKTWRARLATISLFLAGAIPPVAAWFLRNKLAAGNATNRTFQFHPIVAENIQPGFYNFSQFLMPVEAWRFARKIVAMTESDLVKWILAALGLALLLWLAVNTWNIVFRQDHRLPQSLTFATALYIFGYLGAVLFSMSFFDASTKFQPRILAPLYVSLMLLLVALMTWLWRENKLPFSISRPLVLTVLLVTLAFSTYENIQKVAEFKTTGQGYASWKWHDSLVMATLQSLPPETTIYTNTPPAVYLVTGRASRVLPTPIDPVDNLVRGNYERDLAQIRVELVGGSAVLALFDTSQLEAASATGMHEIELLCAGLDVLQKAQGDILYGFR